MFGDTNGLIGYNWEYYRVVEITAGFVLDSERV